MSLLSLLRTRRMGPLVLSQACGAFNDNLVKNAMVILALFNVGSEGPGFAALAGALFIAPYVVLSATAGQLADRFSKSRLIVIMKAAECLLMAVAAYGFIDGNMSILLGVLCGLGIQSAMFGPMKYGILPEALAENELVDGNGLVEAATFASILAGTVVGGALVLLDNGLAMVSATGFGVSLIGLASALVVPHSRAADPSIVVGWRLPSETIKVVVQAAGNRPVWLSILGLSWFWAVGALLLSEFPSLARDVLEADGHMVTLLLTVFAIGVGGGSLLSALLLRGEVSARHVPFAALGITFCTWDFANACTGVHMGGVSDAFTSFAGWRMMADLLLLSVCGGLYSTPLYALVQKHALPSHRARTVAANNVMNALLMVAASGVVGACAWLGYAPTFVLKLAAAGNFLVALWIFRLLPQESFKVMFRWYFETFHGVDLKGMHNYHAAGDRVIIISNHLSFADASLIACYLPGNPTFAVHAKTAGFWWARPFLMAVDIFKVDVQSAYSIKRMVEAVRDDKRKLMIFPEGRLTKTGSLMKVYEGAAVVADKSGAMVLPINIDGLQFTRVGRMKGKLRLRWFPRLSITIMPPVNLTPADAQQMTPRQRREAVGRALQDVLVQTAFRAKVTDRTLFSAMLDARARHGGGTDIIEDTNRSPLTYDRLVLGSAVIGRALASITMAGEHVGVLLPNSNGTVVTFMGLQAFGRVPAMLNVSAGSEGMLAACAAAQVKTVLCSRAFVARAKLEKVIERMEAKVFVIWLEDIRNGIGMLDKIRGKLSAWSASSLPAAMVSPDSPAVILFTSGSEGTPKGVVLSHRNIISNIAQLSSVIDFSPADRVFNAMPMFHSFGLTGGTLLPLLSGVRTFHYPSPLHYRIVPALMYDTDTTICFGTDTFLTGWARYAHPYDMYSMRYIFAGAEKVREETKALYAQRFGARVLEGYGATETSPALAMNTAMHNKAGSVGRFLPGIEWRLVPVFGIKGGGRLYVRGPNVMLGYMRVQAPGVLEPVEDGWYDTGDIVDVDGRGFVTITGRAKRFAKVAGEMVSMAAAESLAYGLWPDAAHAVVGLPDPRKGEQLMLVTTGKDATSRALVQHARERGTPEIMVPRLLLVIDAMPLLGTGKVDYPAVQRLADASVASSALAAATSAVTDAVVMHSAAGASVPA